MVAMILSFIFSWNNFIFGVVLAGRDDAHAAGRRLQRADLRADQLGAARRRRADRDRAGAAADVADAEGNRRRADGGWREGRLSPDKAHAQPDLEETHDPPPPLACSIRVCPAAPAIVERANAQSAFDWKQFKGQTIEVNYQLSPRGDVAKAHMKEFEELTGIKVGFEQIPEQQQRPKVAMEMATGHPSFDVVNVGMHVQKRLIERAKWMEDLRPYIADKSLTTPDFDQADFSKPSMEVATGADGKLNVLPLNQDLFILFYNKELFAQKGFECRAEDARRDDDHGACSSPMRRRGSMASSAAA